MALNDELMILSMTGYGKAEYNFADHKTIVEIRSLNSKQLDLTLKVAPLFRDKEPDIRALLTAPLERGKVDVNIYTVDGGASEGATQGLTPINKEAFAYYYQELTDLQSSLNMPGNQNIMAAILRIPGVLQQNTAQESVTDEEWGLLQQAINEALTAFRAFRVQEGAALEKMFTEKLDGIARLLAEVEPYEKDRIATIRGRLMDNLSKISEQKGSITDKKVSVAYDQSRLEAELIYYLEKLDITEEKVRLKNHIKYFRETMQEEGAGVGKKLGFIAQEMGREINTLGSKSNQSEMQILDVQMKDILEQIKEQVLNVL